MLHAIPAAEAFSVAALQTQRYTIPEHTLTGVVCGDCTTTFRRIEGDRTLQARHATVEHVRFCYAARADMDAEAAAERAAEMAMERYFEDRGYEEARGQEDYERRLGIL